MAERLPPLHLVFVAPADTRLGHIPGVDQIAQDLLGRTFGYPHAHSEVADSRLRILGDGKQYVPVVAQKRPLARVIGTHACDVSDRKANALP